MTTDATGALVPVKEAVNPNYRMLVLLVFVQVLYVCLIYGPIAAYLIEAFPAKIRYTRCRCRITSATACSVVCCR